VRACERTGSGSFERLDGTAAITGVGFFNVSHGQTGERLTRSSCTRCSGSGGAVPRLR